AALMFPEAAQGLGIRVDGVDRLPAPEELTLKRLREDGEVLEKGGAGPRIDRQKGSARVTPHRSRKLSDETPRRFAGHRGKKTPVYATEVLVPDGDAIAVVPEEELVGALPGEHHLDVVAGQAGDEVERDTRGKGDGLVLVPDQLRQRVEELLRGYDDLVVD